MPRLWRRTAASRQRVDVRDELARLGPDGIEVHARTLAVGSQLAATLVVTGYPAEVVPGWLDPLLTYPGRLDVALHIEPVPSALAARQLKTQRARLESTRRTGFDRGRLDDPDTEAAAQDAAELAYRIARGEGKLFRVGLYMTVYGRDEEHLADEVASVRSVAESLLVSTAPATYRSLPGWLATLPLGLDTLKVRRTFDTEALAACFPFASPDLPADTAMRPGGVLYGVNTASGSLVLWDRFAQDNYNSVLLARSGAGKSYLTKLELLRLLFTGIEARVIDPEDEYVRLAEAVGGTVIRLGDPAVRLNPFDLPPSAGGDGDALTRRVLFLHTFLSVLFGAELSAAERAVLDRAVLATYRHAGISTDPATWSRPAPLLKDLAEQLTTMTDAAAG
ncbi:VirB4 family type IV secretion system protein [Streptomyces monticola]|uniref:VirB4 family type IV secretion system protein n=1 Tax=Streptomyces monticola TaxID=2666263 RepID=A0ABW2JHT4_9ACTN